MKAHPNLYAIKYCVTLVFKYSNKHETQKLSSALRPISLNKLNFKLLLKLVKSFFLLFYFRDDVHADSLANFINRLKELSPDLMNLSHVSNPTKLIHLFRAKYFFRQRTVSSSLIIIDQIKVQTFVNQTLTFSMDRHLKLRLLI